MKRLKRSLSVILALVTVMACSISSFASVYPHEPSPNLPTYQDVWIIEEDSVDVITVKAGQGFGVTNFTSKDLKVYGDGAYINTVPAVVAAGAYTYALAYDVDAVLQFTYKKNSHKVYIKNITAETVAAAQTQAATQAQAAPEVKNTPAAQAAPAASNAAAGVPDLSNPEIKALWDQAVAIKAAYDAETNAKNKKKLQKQFTDIMNQIPLK